MLNISGPWAQNQYVILALVLWELAWKGFALWKSARRDQKYWYVAILLVNSFGLLPIIYLIIYRKK